MSAPRSARERKIVLALREILARRYAWAVAHRKPSASPQLLRSLEDALGYVPLLQPEIDLCFGDDSGRAYAVEVKAFPSSALTFRMPFYEGIGQALALHRYGFDGAALWFVFLGAGARAGAKRYGAQAWYFLRNQLQLPLDFMFFLSDSVAGREHFAVQQYTSNRTSVDLLSLDDPRLELGFRYPNPLLASGSDAAKIRAALVPWLRGIR